MHELQRNPRYIQDQYRPFCRKGLKVLDLNEIVKWEKMSHINCVNRGSSTRLISIVAVLFLVENCGDNVIWTSWHKPSLRQQQYCFRIETHRWWRKGTAHGNMVHHPPSHVYWHCRGWSVLLQTHWDWKLLKIMNEFPVEIPMVPSFQPDDAHRQKRVILVSLPKSYWSWMISSYQTPMLIDISQTMKCRS